MKTTTLAPMVILTAAMLLGPSTGAQTWPVSGLYQIVSGDFKACCGIAGPVHTRLPNSDQTFIGLTVDHERNLAQMTILGEDGNTVFSVVLALPPSTQFFFSFDDGVVSPSAVQFGDPILPPNPPTPAFGYTVTSNAVDGLALHGELVLPCPGCSDAFTQFTHTNVVAVLLPPAVPSVRVSEIEVCWVSVPNRTYQVQYQSSLTTNLWTNLGAPVAGTGTTLCLADKVPPGQPQRFYRVLTLP